MKFCSLCHRAAPEAAINCPFDSSPLIDGADIYPGPGDSIAGYQIIEVAAAGSTSIVYRAVNSASRREVAIKLLTSDFCQTKIAMARIRRETTKTIKIDSPHVAEVIESGDFDDRFFIVREWLEGDPLSSIMQREGPMTVDRTLQIAHQVCSSIEAIHKASLIHRDLKPNHVFLTQSDGILVVKLLDTGIVSKSSVKAGRADIYGTPEYLAPEQAEGKMVYPRTDLYALGGLIFRMLVGRPPFEGSPQELIDQHKSSSPPTLAENVDDVPPQLDKLVTKLLSKAGTSRPFSASVVLKELSSFSLPKSKSLGRAPSGLSAPITGKVVIPRPKSGPVSSSPGASASSMPPTPNFGDGDSPQSSGSVQLFVPKTPSSPPEAPRSSSRPGSFQMQDSPEPSSPPEAPRSSSRPGSFQMQASPEPSSPPEAPRSSSRPGSFQMQASPESSSPPEAPRSSSRPGSFQMQASPEDSPQPPRPGSFQMQASPEDSPQPDTPRSSSRPGSFQMQVTPESSPNPASFQMAGTSEAPAAPILAVSPTSDEEEDVDELDGLQFEVPTPAPQNKDRAEQSTIMGMPVMSPEKADEVYAAREAKLAAQKAAASASQAKLVPISTAQDSPPPMAIGAQASAPEPPTPPGVVMLTTKRTPSPATTRQGPPQMRSPRASKSSDDDDMASSIAQFKGTKTKVIMIAIISIVAISAVAAFVFRYLL